MLTYLVLKLLGKMKIAGIGIDLIEIERIKKLIKRNERFRRRLFSPAEISYCESKINKFQHFAVRFAAKEAVWKALGRKGISLKSIEIINSEKGKPEVVLSGKLNKKIALSLSHCKDYAVAQAILMRE